VSLCIFRYATSNDVDDVIDDDDIIDDADKISKTTGPPF
jgi:hypothetical protein